MALTLEEILLDMKKNKVARQPVEFPEPEYLRRDREELARVMAITNNLGPPDPPPPSYLDKLSETLRAIGGAISGGPSSFEQPIIPSTGGGIETVSELPSIDAIPGIIGNTLMDIIPDNINKPTTPGKPAFPVLPTLSENLPPAAPRDAVSEIATGIGEAATTLGTGFVGFVRGGMGMAEEYLRNPPTPFSTEQFSPGYIPPPVDKDYWKNLLKKGTEISQSLTYEPKTPEGKAIIEKGVTPIFEALHSFSRGASEAPISRMLFTEDQREVVAYVHELLTMTAIGELGSSVKGAIGRKLSGDYQKAFVDAAKEGPQGGPATEKLGTLANEIKERAATSPEVQEKFSPERVQELRAKQQEQGFSELDQGLERIREIENFEKGIEATPPVVSSTPALRPSRKSRTQKEGSVEATIEVPEAAPGVPPVPQDHVRLYRVDLSPEERVNLPTGTDFTRSHRAETDLNYIRDWRNANAPDGDIYYIDVPWNKNDPMEPMPPVSINAQQRTQLKLFEKSPIATEQEAPRPVPDWIKETRDQIASQADTLGITERIKKLALEGKTAAQIVNEIPEFQQVPIQDRTGIVRAVRAREGIPSLEEVRGGEGTLSTPSTPLENPFKITGERGGPYEVTREGRKAESFSNRRSAERFAAKEWKNEQAPPEIREVEATLEEVSKSRTRGTPSKKSAEEKLQAVESANEYTSRESTVRRVQEAIDKNIDITKELYDASPGDIEGQLATLKFIRAREIARAGIDTSRKRAVMDIINDIATLLKFDVDPTKLGGNLLNVSISYAQRQAAKRLAQDLGKHNILQESLGQPIKSLEQHIDEANIGPVKKELIKSYLGSEMVIDPALNGFGPKNMKLDGKAMTGEDWVVSRHINRYKMPTGEVVEKLGPATYKNEVLGIGDANKLELSDLSYDYIGLEKPRRIVKKAGQPVYDMIFDPADRAMKVIKEEQLDVKKDLAKLEQLVKRSDRQNITRQVEEGNPASLKGDQKQIYDIIGAGDTNILTRANEAREAIGQLPLPEEVFNDPVGTMRAINAAASDGLFVNLVTTPPQAILDVLNSSTTQQFKPTFTQNVIKLTSEMDIFRQYATFANKAAHEINFSTLTAKWRALANEKHLDVGLMDGTEFTLESRNPGLHKLMNDLANSVDGKPMKPMIEFEKKWGPMLQKYGENMSWTVLSGNLRSVMAQPFSLINTSVLTGYENIVMAAGDVFYDILRSGGKIDEAVARSELLSSRKNSPVLSGIGSEVSDALIWDTLVGKRSPGELKSSVFKRISESAKEFGREAKASGREAGYALSEGRVRDFTREIARVGLAALEQADFMAAVISWNAFDRLGKSKGLKGKELDRFNDDGMVNTQASGAAIDRSRIQMTALGRASMQFGNFGLTDLSFMINEIIKPIGKEPPKETLVKVARLVGAITAFNTVANYIGFDPPTPQPIKAAMDSIEKGDNPFNTMFKVGLELTQPVLQGPFSSLKLGLAPGGPLVGNTLELFRSGLDKPGAKNPLEPISKFAPIPAASTFWRVHRGDPQATGLQRLLNYNPRTSGGGSLDSGLGSGLGKGMSSGLPK